MKQFLPPQRIRISATQARRDLFQIINRAHFDHHVFLIVKHGKVLAILQGRNYRAYVPPKSPQLESSWGLPISEKRADGFN